MRTECASAPTLSHTDGSPIIRANARVEVGWSLRSDSEAGVCPQVSPRRVKMPCAASRSSTRRRASGVDLAGGGEGGHRYGRGPDVVGDAQLGHDVQAPGRDGGGDYAPGAGRVAARARPAVAARTAGAISAPQRPSVTASGTPPPGAKSTKPDARCSIKHFPDLDVLFGGVGTAGTAMGCLRYLRDTCSAARVVAVDAVGSVSFGSPSASRLIPGVGAGVVPPLLTPDAFDDVVLVPEEASVRMCRAIAARGLLFGGSTGTVVDGARTWLERNDPQRTLRTVCISADMGDRYLDTIYDDDWVLKMGRLIVWLRK